MGEPAVAAGFLHVFIIWVLFNPGAVFPCAALWLAIRMMVHGAPRAVDPPRRGQVPRRGQL